jgi:hypothetical protein
MIVSMFCWGCENGGIIAWIGRMLLGQDQASWPSLQNFPRLECDISFSVTLLSSQQFPSSDSIGLNLNLPTSTYMSGTRCIIVPLHQPGQHPIFAFWTRIRNVFHLIGIKRNVVRRIHRPPPVFSPPGTRVRLQLIVRRRLRRGFYIE